MKWPAFSSGKLEFLRNGMNALTTRAKLTPFKTNDIDKSKTSNVKC